MSSAYLRTVARRGPAPDVTGVRDVLTHVGAPSEDVAAYELLVGLRAEKLTVIDLFDFLTSSRPAPEPGEHRGSA